MGKAIVAICVPYYKKRHALIRLLESIKKQTYKQYVVIVTDDSEDDEVKEYIERLGERYIYIRNIEKKGPTANCNCAIEQSQKYNPKYIKVMHHDDFFSFDDSLEQFVKIMDENPSVNLSFSNVIVHNKEMGKVYKRDIENTCIEEIRNNIYTLVEKNMFGAPSAVMIRNSRIYMDENLIWLVDVEWYLKILEQNRNFIYISDTLISIGVDGNRVTNYCLKNRDIVQREYIYTYIKHYQIPKDNIIEAVISNCVRNYNGQTQVGFYCKEEYLAIIRDALRDGKKICFFAEKQDERVEDIMNKIFLVEEFYYWFESSKQENEYSLEEIGRNMLCVILNKKAREIRKKLNGLGINAIPYIENYLV